MPESPDLTPDEQALAAAQIHMGDTIGGKYRIDRILGAGGMGIVAAAHHVDLEQAVALKFLLVGDPRHRDEFVSRFRREAKVASKVNSEHVVRVMDVGTTATGIPYIVMELLEGEDLDAVLEREGFMEQTLAVDLVIQTCAALAEAHAAGIVHRDIKPANLFLTHRRDGSPCIKILDFGISKANEREGAQSLTGTNATMGSPTHMAPEQWISAKSVDHRSDIWSLGAVLFELLTGRLAFDGSTMPEICQRVLNQEPAYPEDITVLPGLKAVIARCLSKDPEDRFEHVGAVASALYAFAGRQGQIAADQTIGAINASVRFSMGGASPVTLADGSRTGGRNVGVTRASGSQGEAANPHEAITVMRPGSGRQKQWDGDTAMNTTTSVVRRQNRARRGVLLGLGALAGLGIGLAIWRATASAPTAIPSQDPSAAAAVSPPDAVEEEPTPTPPEPVASVDVDEPDDPPPDAEPAPSAEPKAPPVHQPRPVVVARPVPKKKPAPPKPAPPPAPPKPKGDPVFDGY